MPMHYTDPSRERDPHALPDVDTFGPTTVVTCPLCDRMFQHEPMGGVVAPDVCECGEDLHDEPRVRGYFYRERNDYADPIGPFATEADALADAREGRE